MAELSKGVIDVSTLQAINSMVEVLPESDRQEVFAIVRKLFLARKTNPFTPKTEEEFYASIDRGIAEADAGIVQDMDEAIDEIGAVLAL